MNYSELIESFTSNVIKKTKETTIEDKRKNILSLYDITKHTIDHLIEKDGTLENAGKEFYDNVLPEENTYGKEISYENTDKEEVSYSFVLWKAYTRVPLSYTLYIALNKGEELCYINFQKVYNNQYGDSDALEYAILEPDKRGGGRYQYPLIKEYSDIIIKFVKIYLKYRKRFLGLKAFNVGLIKNVFNGDLNESFTSKVIKDVKEKTIEDKRNDLFDFVDLGLPSGNMWCKHNYGADDAYEDGEYLSYIKAIEQDFSPGELPSRDDFVELYKNCKYEWTDINGIKGVVFTSNTNGKTLFFPAAGVIHIDHNNLKNEEGHYWSSTEYQENSVYTRNNAYEMLIYDGNKYCVRPQYYNHVSQKNSIRLVLKKKSIKESFTNNVIKNVKNTTQEEKREIVSTIDFKDKIIEKFFHKYNIYTISDAAKVEDYDLKLMLFAAIHYDNFDEIQYFNEFKYFKKVTTIPENAFSYTNLKEITFPDSIEMITDSAFKESKIEKVIFSKNLKYIVAEAFTRTLCLKEIDLRNTKIRTIPYKCFYGSSIERIYLPETLEVIGQYAFAMSNLKEIILHPNCKLNEIQSNAFNRCQISKFDFKEGLIEIGNSAFYSCLLRTISFPSTLQKIGCNCFDDNSNLINVEFPENSELRSINSNAFRHTKLSKIVLPKNLRYIDNPFRNKLSDVLTIYYHPSQIEMINYLKREYNVGNYIFTEIKDNINESFTSKVIDKVKSTSQDEKRREIFDYVDLDLPNGTLWCRHNYGATQEYDKGNLYNYEEASNLDFKDGERLPNVIDTKELVNCCNREYAIINGVKGVKFISKKNNDHYIFLPCTSIHRNNNDYPDDFCINDGYYWTSIDIGNYSNKILHTRFNGSCWPNDSVPKSSKIAVRTVKRLKSIKESFTSKVIKSKKEEKEQIDNHDGLYILAEISEENILKLYEEWCDNTTFRDPVHADEQDEFCKIMPYTIKYKFKKGKPTMEERIARSFKQFIFEKTNGNLVFRYSPEWGQEKLQCIEFFDFTEIKNMRSMKNSIGYSHDKEHPSYFYGTEYSDRFIKYKKNENLIKDWYIPVFVSVMKEDKKGLCKKFEKYFI